jgi:hypothetical protein
MSLSSSERTSPITRRGLLCGASALSVLALIKNPAPAFAASLDRDAFVKLSQELVGQARLSNDVATRMLEAFTTLGKGEALASLAAGKSDDELANTIVAGWYTGESPLPDADEVLEYTDALIWDAMDYSKPMAYCGGATGYWADPPEQ